MLNAEQQAWLRESLGYDIDGAMAGDAASPAGADASGNPASGDQPQAAQAGGGTVPDGQGSGGQAPDVQPATLSIDASGSQASADQTETGQVSDGQASNGQSATPTDPALQTPQTGQKADQQLFGKESKDEPDIAESDINQGTTGDCYLLSSIGEIARINPELIRKMIKDNGDGTYTVTLYQKKGGFWAGVAGAFGANDTFKPVQVTVDGNFPASSSANPLATQDKVADTGKKEIWVQVLEKAYAKLNGGYSAIGGGGHATDAMEALTGQSATEKSTGTIFGISLSDLQAAFTAGKPIVMNTPKGESLPYNLVGHHAYMLDDIIVDPKGGAQIKLRNPWGTTQSQPPQLIPFDKLSSGICSVDIGGSLPKASP